MKQTFEISAYPSPVDHGVVQRDWAAAGFSFGVFRDNAGQEWNDFTHTTHEYVVVASGTMTITVEGETAQCRAGDLVSIPKGARHSLKTTSAEGSVWLYGYGSDD
jgi:quercetin dioxygenase-like cupin family protein